ncbi:unnamed protein product [Hymenolepis diminuta]|uniref:Secreted protein n=1 Tax=Hymenolepis diminuta TaxID=6216 RepID=A0A0R3SR29_HYMDI|nr:unnamed protein product [Hymenolepis diminuta]
MLTLMYSFSTSLWRCDFLSAQLRQLSSVLTICVKVALFSSLPSPKMSYETGPGVNAVCATFTYPFSDPSNPHVWFRQLKNRSKLQSIIKQKRSFNLLFLLFQTMSARLQILQD